MKLLLVVDDLDLSVELSRGLVSRGYKMHCSGDGAEALAAARKKSFDVVVLDLTLPTLDGLEILQRLRSDGNTTPVLVLTASGSVAERIACLNAGADDYLVKPFDLEELVARLGALTRRLGRDGSLRCGRLHYEAASGVFYSDKSPLELTPRETELLKCLMSRVERAVPKEALRDAVFGAGDNTRVSAVEVIVHRLRKKLLGASVELLTLRSVGYLLCDDASTTAQQAAR
jgi:DNA-binding response OmpR family regulator